MASKRVAICGGGVAALEAMLALRELLPLRPHIDLVAPNRSFVYEPLAVAEPFGLASTRLLDVADVAQELGAELHVGTLERVEPEQRSVVLASGTRLPYDAAIVAVGARRRSWLRGAISFGGAEDADAFARTLGRVQAGELARLAFTAPAQTAWTLPLYELALLTASWLAEQAIAGVELTVVTPEREPLRVFGTGASRMLRDQLADRGISLHAGAAVAKLRDGALHLDTGEQVAADAVVALPRLVGRRIGGLPADDEGFIPVDERCRVLGVADVYAAGDGTSFPVKQGGIATQQADVAAEAIAERLGSPRPARASAPVLRGMLLTGVAPMYLRAVPNGQHAEIAAAPLWAPPAKIAGRLLGPYLAGRGQAEPEPGSRASE